MNNGYYKGRGAQFNTKNRFLTNEFVKEHVEGIDEESSPNHARKVFFESQKKIISENSSPDIPFRYSINPYQGCEHGCVYCYARNTHSYWGFSAGMDWESKIIAKMDAAKMLEKVFLKKSWKPDAIMVSGNTDPYQPLEKKLRITRSLLEVFARYQNPVGMITKNSLVARDLDILKYLAELQLVRVYFSITTVDEKLRRIMEPRTANAMKMMNTMELLANAGVKTGLLMGPIIPSINDHEIDNILRLAADHGARSASFTLARFNGDVSEIFADWLKRNFPERAPKVWNKVKNMHGGSVGDSRFGTRMMGEGNYAEMIRSVFHAARKKYFKEEESSPLRKDIFRTNGNLF
jgi:DNA repair photolyase